MIKINLALIGLFLVLAVVVIIIISARSSGGQQALKIVRVAIGQRVYDVEVAQNALQKMRGLSGRDSLTESHGMLFPFSSAGLYPFWMKGMKFSIDFVWIRADTPTNGAHEYVDTPTNGAREYKVVDITENALPATSTMPVIYKPDEPADTVLEVPAGTVAKDRIKIGDSVKMVIDN